MRITPVKLYLGLVRRLHFLVLLSLMVPCFCLISTYGLTDAQAQEACSRLLPLYVMTFLLALPASFMYVIQEKVKGLGSYLLCALPVSVLFLACLFFLEQTLGFSIRKSERIPQAVILLLYLLDAIRMRTNDNSRKKAKAEDDFTWTGDVYLLPRPMLPLLIPFAVIYVGALFLHSNEIAQCALIGAILYFFLALPYHVLVQREDYFESRHRISRIPARRIAKLQGASLIRVLIPCALLAAASLMTAGGRTFLDMPTINLGLDLSPDIRTNWSNCLLLRKLWSFFFLNTGSPPPQWLLNLIFFVENVLTVFMTALLVWALWRIVRSIIIRFRKVAEEEADASLSGEARDEHISLRKKRPRYGSGRGDKGVRRRYRRTILRALHQAPEPYETPAMMEQRAGLADTPQMRILHEEYEYARYGRGESGS